MKWFVWVPLLVTVLVIRHDAGGDTPVSFEGMTAADVTNMYALSDTSFTIVNAKTYQDAFVVANPAPLLKTAAPKGQIDADVSVMKSGIATDSQKIQAVIDYIRLNGNL